MRASNPENRGMQPRSIRDADGAEAEILGRLTDFEGRRVLEVGCGDGRLTWLTLLELRTCWASIPMRS